MTKDMTPLPIDESGNGERLRTLTYDYGDAAMLWATALLGANTVMMCGGGKAENRMRYYQEKFREQCPPGFEHFKREEDIANIAITMMDAEKCTFQRVRRWRGDKDAVTRIAISGKTWENWSKPDADNEKILECLRAICPMGCEIEVLEDEVQKGW